MDSVDAFQRRNPVIGLPVAVIYKFFDDQGNYLSAIITYYAFVAIFPLGLLATSILGFVLQGDPELQKRVLVKKIEAHFKGMPARYFHMIPESLIAEHMKIIHDFIVKTGANPRKISDEEILERTIYPMINEGAKILEEGKAIRASDIDVVWVNGYGWPVYRGGPMYYADQVGLDKILAKLKDYQGKYGDAYKPAALLEKLVAEGKRFRDLK